MRIKGFLIACALMVAAATTVNAQAPRPAPMTNPANTDGRQDTVLNATTKNFAAYMPTDGRIAFQYISTKISGTVAGKIYLQASIDPTGIATSNYVSVDSATLVDGNNSVLKSYLSNHYYFWRWQVVPTGSSASTANAYFLRK